MKSKVVGKTILVIVLVLIAVASSGCTVNGVEVPEFQTFGEFLAWMSGPSAGSLVLILIAVSWGLEPFAFWQKLTSKVKYLIIIAFSVALAALAMLLSNYPNVISAIDPYYRLLTSTIGVWLTLQAAHRLDTRPAKITDGEKPGVDVDVAG